MKAVILPSSNLEINKSLSTNVPEFLIPIVNKPIVEHLVELLERNGVREILMGVKDKFDKTKDYFGNGERWGVNIKYYHVKPDEKCASVLKQNREFLDKPFICLPSNCVTNLNVRHFNESFKNSRGGMEISHTYCSGSNLDRIPTFSDISHREKSIFILDPAALGYLCEETDNDLKHISEKLIQNHIHVNIFRSPHQYAVVENVEDVWTLDQKILKGEFSDVIIPGEEKEKGVWIGQNVNVHPSVKFESPILIGSFSKIGERVTLKSGSVVGENVVVDKNSSVENASIWNDTYAGAYTEIKNCVIFKDVLFSVSHHTTIQISDPFILGANSIENIFGFKYWFSKYVNPLKLRTRRLTSKDEKGSFSNLFKFEKLKKTLSHAITFF